MLITAGALLVSVVLVLLSLVLISRIEFFHVAEVHTTGTVTLDAQIISDEIEQRLTGNHYYVFPMNNRYLIPEKRIRSYLLDTYPKIRSLDFDVVGDIYKISLSEREPHSLWCGHTSSIVASGVTPDCYFTDATGFIFARAPYLADTSFYKVYGRPTNSVEKTTTDVAVSLEEEMIHSQRALEYNLIGTQYVPRELYEEVMGFANILQSEGINSYALEMQAREAQLLLSGGGVLRFRTDQDLMTLLEDIVLAYNTKREDGSDMSEIDYIDVRFTNKILFKFVDQPLEAPRDE